MSFTVPVEVKERLKAIAAERGISLSALVREITAVPDGLDRGVAQ